VKPKELTSGTHGSWVLTKEGLVWVSRNKKTRKEDEKMRKEKGNLPGINTVGWALSRLYW